MSKDDACTVSFEHDGRTVTRTVRGPSAVVGRSPECDVVIPEVGISRTHARLVFEEGAWKIIDLDSVNGTFLNGVRVSAARLSSGDRVMLGHIGLDVAVDAAGIPVGGGKRRAADHGATLAIETVAEERVVSVVCGRLDKFSWVAQAMPAAAVAVLLNGVFEQLAALVDELGGTICAITGDGFTVFFAESATWQDHAVRATECAWRMRQEIEAMAARLDTASPLSMRFGVNSGAAVVGDIGPATHRQYTVVGDTAIVAERLAYTTAMTGEILVGKTTRDAVAESFVCRGLPAQKLRGRRQRLEPFVVEERR